MGNSDYKAQCYDGQDLAGADFSGKDLEGATFRKAVLTEANFTAANIRGCDFSGATLAGADLSTAHVGVSPVRFTDLLFKSLGFALFLGVTLNEGSAAPDPFVKSQSIGWLIQASVACLVVACFFMTPSFKSLIHHTEAHFTSHAVAASIFVAACIVGISRAIHLLRKYSSTSFDSADLSGASLPKDYETVTQKT